MAADRKPVPYRRKTPRERFLTVTPKRVQGVFDALNLLANCGNRATYKYTQAEVSRMFDQIEHEVAWCRARFYRKGRQGFSFDE